MKLHMDYLNLRWFQNEIAGTRNELILLRRALDKSLQSLKASDIKESNPVTISLLREIEEHEALLRRSERKLILVTN